jgi:hypothetical protein
VADTGLVSRLHELIAALDRRHPRPERPGEAAIARASAELRSEAIARLAALDAAPPSPVA